VANALVIAANQNTQKGDIQSATTTIERAIRIEPRNATLYYQLAVLRLKESKPTLAEDLAKKCLLLASNDTRLKKHSWLLIAEAREMQKDFDGSKEAKDKADGF
jgi:Tfp pilus assembly protein PilF